MHSPLSPERSTSRAAAGCPTRAPGLFAPAGVVDPTVAGYGVVDPAAMLLAVSLLLATGLREHAAAKTLERAVVAAQTDRRRRSLRRPGRSPMR